MFEWKESEKFVAEIMSNLKNRAILSDSNAEFVVMINNCDYATSLEMKLIVNEFMKQFKEENCKVVRLIFGNLMSSLERSGISISVLNVNGKRRDEILKYIDLEVDSPFWPKVVNLEEVGV